MTRRVLLYQCIFTNPRLTPSLDRQKPEKTTPGATTVSPLLFPSPWESNL